MEALCVHGEPCVSTHMHYVMLNQELSRLKHFLVDHLFMLKIYKRHCCAVSKYTGYGYSTAAENLTLTHWPASSQPVLSRLSQLPTFCPQLLETHLWMTQSTIWVSLPGLFYLTLWAPSSTIDFIYLSWFYSKTHPLKKKKSSQHGLFEFLSKKKEKTFNLVPHKIFHVGHESVWSEDPRNVAAASCSLKGRILSTTQVNSWEPL